MIFVRRRKVAKGLGGRVDLVTNTLNLYSPTFWVSVWNLRQYKPEYYYYPTSELIRITGVDNIIVTNVHPALHSNFLSLLSIIL